MTEANSLLLALDFGGTKHTAATTTSGSTQWLAFQRALSPPISTAQGDLQIMRSLIQEVLNGAKPAAIGVSFGGPVDFATGIVRLSHHVTGWESVRLRDLLQTEWQAPTWVDNDANVAALGEYHFGAGQGCRSLFYITVSTGVGGGWLLNGMPWRGAEGMAGEIGHTVVDPTGPLCLCGKRGCVERWASGAYIAQDIQTLLKQQADYGQILRQLVQDDLSAITAQQVSVAASQGDSVAQHRLDQAAWALGVGIGNTANLINPQRFVLGGGVTKAGDRFWHSIRQVARQTALPEINVDIVPAALGDDAPLWGAIALATQKPH